MVRYIIQSVLRTRYSLEALRSMHRMIQSVLQPRSLPKTILSVHTLWNRVRVPEGPLSVMLDHWRFSLVGRT